MARSMRQALMGEEQIGTLDNPGSASPLGPTLSMRTGAFLHPLLQAAKDKFPKHNPRGRWLGEMLLGDSPQRTGRVAEGIPDQYFHFNRGSGSNVSPELVDLAGALPIASTLNLAKAAAVPAAMASAGLLGRAVKGADYAPASMDDLGAALLGQRLQRQGLLDDAMVTYHGSPHQFDEFSLDKIGTGEGAQAYGHGLYFAENPEVAGQYVADRSHVGRFMATGEQSDFDVPRIAQNAVDIAGNPEDAAAHLRKVLAANSHSRNPAQAVSNKEVADAIELIESGAIKRQGALYEVDIPDTEIAKMLDWDAPLSEQPWFRDVKELAAEYKKDGKPADNYAKMIARANARGDVTGKQFYEGMTGTPAEKSAFLERAGIPGIKYWDGDSRSAGDGTRNFVVFDDKLPTILERDGEKIAQPSVDDLARRADETIAQSISSANTSIKQVPALFKSKLFGEYKGNKNVDLGGGKFDLGSDYLKSQGVQNDVYDPFNRSAEHNKTVLDAAKTVPPDTVTVNNVLNVIQEPSVRANVIQQAKDIIKPGGSVFFQIYEGTGKGVGGKTTKGFQNNKKTNEYLEEIQKVFPDAERRGNVIIGTSSEPSVDEFIGKLLED